MGTREIKITVVEGRQVIGTGDLVYCNTKYHRPYLAVVRGEEMDWQEKIYVGYGKRRETYYIVEALQPGDLIQAAGGSGGSKYPFKGKILQIGDDVLILEEMTDVEFGNARKAHAEPAPLTETELELVNRLRNLTLERLSLVLAAVRR